MSDGDGDPASASDSPVPATPSHRSAGRAVRAAQPTGGHVIDEDPREMTKVKSGRTRQASERRDHRAEGQNTDPLPDSAVVGPSRSLDGEHRHRQPASPNEPAAAFTVAALVARAMAMFLGAGERPVASGDTRKAAVAMQATRMETVEDLAFSY